MRQLAETDQFGELSELNASMYPDVPAKWETLKQLIQPTHQPDNK